MSTVAGHQWSRQDGTDALYLPAYMTIDKLGGGEPRVVSPLDRGYGWLGRTLGLKLDRLRKVQVKPTAFDA